MEKKIIETFSLIQKRVEKIDLSGRISSEIEELMNPNLKIQNIFPAYVKVALISVIVFLAVFIFIPFKKTGKLPNDNILKEDIQKMTLQYARISGKEAKKYYFKSDNSNRLIVWIQKKGD